MESVCLSDGRAGSDITSQVKTVELNNYTSEHLKQEDQTHTHTHTHTHKQTRPAVCESLLIKLQFSKDSKTRSCYCVCVCVCVCQSEVISRLGGGCEVSARQPIS